MPTYIVIASVLVAIPILAELRRRGSLGGPNAAKRSAAERARDRRELGLLWAIAAALAVPSLAGALQWWWFAALAALLFLNMIRQLRQRP